MAFDGAAYYNLPSSSQASSSGSSIGNEAVLQQARALNAARRGDGSRVRSRGAGASSSRGRGMINRPATGLPANPNLLQQQQPQHYGYPQMSMMPPPQQEYNAWSQQPQQSFSGHHSLPQRPQMNVHPSQNIGWQQPQFQQFQQPQLPYFPPQYGNFMPGQMYTPDGYGVSPTAYMQPAQPLPPPVQQSMPDYSMARTTPFPPTSSTSRSAFCQLCSMKFKDEIRLIAHQRNEHARCCKADEGCTFEGLPHVVEIHEQDRHLVFRPGAKREKSKPDGPPGARIQGTNLNLETEEDIAKWIAERKRKWPGSKNAEVQAERNAKRRAYEEASPANMTTREQGPTRGRGRGRGERIRGTGGLARGGMLRDNGWNRQVAGAAEEKTDGKGGAEEASSSDDEEAASIQASLVKADAGRNSMLEVAMVQSDEEPDLDSNDDEGPPEAVSTGRHLDEGQEAGELDDGSEVGQTPASHGLVDSTERAEPQIDTRQKPCQYWVTTGQCKFGKKCRYLHDPAQKPVKRVQPPVPPNNPFERDDLIGKLLHNEVRHEISDLVQVIDFLARNSWMENVELYPGHKEEVENRIKVVNGNSETEVQMLREDSGFVAGSQTLMH